MSKTETKGRAQYEKAREAFTKLDMQDKAAFVLEATFSTFGEAFKDAGKQFADVMEKVSSEDFFSGFGPCTDDAEDAAEEKASEEKATEAKSSNGRKKSGTRSTSKKKKDADD